MPVVAHFRTPLLVVLGLALGTAACGSTEPVAGPAPTGGTTTAAATTTASPEQLAAWVGGFCTAIAPLGTIDTAPPAERIDQSSVAAAVGSIGQYYADAGALATTAAAAVTALGPVPPDGADGFAEEAVGQLETTADMYRGHQLEVAGLDTSDEDAVLAYVAQVDATEPVRLFALATQRGTGPELTAAITADPGCGILDPRAG